MRRLIEKDEQVPFRVTRLGVGIARVLVIVIGFSAFTMTSTASLSTKTGQTRKARRRQDGSET